MVVGNKGCRSTTRKGVYVMYTLWHSGPESSWYQQQEEFPTKAYAIAQAQVYKLMGYRGYYAAVPSSKIATPNTHPDVDATANDVPGGRLVTDATQLLEITKQVASGDDWLQILLLHNIVEKLKGYAPN